MRRNILKVLFLSLGVFLLAGVPQGFAQTGAGTKLTGTWSITHRPVNQAGVPCPFLPETIQFYQDGTVTMSNVPNARFPFKTELTASERKALDDASQTFRGKPLLLIKPSPRMDWLSTPMVYVFAVTGNQLSLTPEGWETATFKRVK